MSIAGWVSEGGFGGRLGIRSYAGSGGRFRSRPRVGERECSRVGLLFGCCSIRAVNATLLWQCLRVAFLAVGGQRFWHFV